TRSKRDWSSDVCSSDLHSNHVASTAAGATISCTVTSKFLDWLSAFVGGFVLADSPRDRLVTPARAAIGSGQASYCASWATHASRSEERRVGTGCRLRGW